ncbi:oligosaccharide flippase family protein [Thioclava sp.]|uniref:lipopolysaccharide biosynthesis protein n=1 Tax=Thioclava sp. TaxID=1933450 RepID=UPI0032421ED9
MIRSIATVLNGNVIAQVIALAALLVISRLFSAETFGAFQLYSSIIVVLLPFAALRLEFLILRLKGSSHDLVRVLALCLGINAVGAGLLALGLILARVSGIWPQASELPFPFWLLPVGFLAMGALQTFNMLPVRNGAYRLVAQARVLQSLVFNASAIVVGLVAPTVPVLLMSDIVSRLGSAAAIFRKSKIAQFSHFDQNDLRWMRSIISKYRHYPIYSVPSGVLSGLSMGLPVMALSALYTISDVGQFSMAWRITLLPIGVLSFSVSQVVNGRIAAIQREGLGPLRPHILRISVFLLGVGIVAGVLAFFLGEHIVKLVLGEKWSMAGVIVTILAPLLVTTLAVAPLNTMLTMLGHQLAQMIWDLSRIGGLVCVFVWSDASGADMQTTVTAFTWASAFFSLAYLTILLSVCDRPDGGKRSTELHEN